MSSDYEKDLEKRIDDLEALWFEDTEGLEAIKQSLLEVSAASKNIEELILNLQDPNSSTNKHGDQFFELIKEKIHSQFMMLVRKINATSIVIDNIRNLKNK